MFSTTGVPGTAAATGATAEAVPATVTIVVKNVYRNTTIQLALPVTEALSSVKRAIREQFDEHPAPDQQRLIYLGKVCSNDALPLKDLLSQSRMDARSPQTFHLVLSNGATRNSNSSSPVVVSSAAAVGAVPVGSPRESSLSSSIREALATTTGEQALQAADSGASSPPPPAPPVPSSSSSSFLEHDGLRRRRPEPVRVGEGDQQHAAEHSAADSPPSPRPDVQHTAAAGGGAGVSRGPSAEEMASWYQHQYHSYHLALAQHMAAAAAHQQMYHMMHHHQHAAGPYPYYPGLMPIPDLSSLHHPYASAYSHPLYASATHHHPAPPSTSAAAPSSVLPHPATAPTAPAPQPGVVAGAGVQAAAGGAWGPVVEQARAILRLCDWQLAAKMVMLVFLLNPGDPTRAACLTVAALLAYLYQTGILALLFPPLFGRPLPLDQQDEDFPGGAAPRRPAEQQQEGGQAAAAAAGGAGGPLAEGQQQQAPPVHQVQEPSGYLSQIARQARELGGGEISGEGGVLTDLYVLAAAFFLSLFPTWQPRMAAPLAPPQSPRPPVMGEPPAPEAPAVVG